MDAMSKTRFEREDLLACARGEMFGPGNAQLPYPPMLMFDRITEISASGGAHGKGHITAELDVHRDQWFFECHFIGDPVMPGCLGLDAMWQLVGFFLGWSGAPGRAGVGRRRGEIHRAGDDRRQAGGLSHRFEARDPEEARHGGRRRGDGGRRETYL